MRTSAPYITSIVVEYLLEDAAIVQVLGVERIETDGNVHVQVGVLQRLHLQVDHSAALERGRAL